MILMAGTETLPDEVLTGVGQHPNPKPKLTCHNFTTQGTRKQKQVMLKMDLLSNIG
jgi:hypothetical protein